MNQPYRRWFGGTLAVLVVALGGWAWLRHPPPQKITAAPAVPRTSVVLREGRWYHPPETNAFAGWLVEFYPDGKLLSRSAVSNGLLNGVSEGWYTNSQIQVREHYKDSVADGLRQKWYENGQAKSEATIVAGKLEGLFRSWHENGRLAERIELVQGHPNGEAWAFYSSGFAKAKTEVRAGQVLAQKRWEDGEYQQASPDHPLAGKAN
jgi:antitoxin component YwqK of YwqJK toxin-antitoxin module